ncbi:MAG TPA: hypothetical protein VG652_08170 [Gaiellaceae bacterium]|nr:hypothetical protein [Gaiellaceae bacterium]
MAARARLHREPLTRRALAGVFLGALVFAAGAGATPNPKKTVTGWIDALAMNGPEVAYSAENAEHCRNIVVWNVLTGQASLVSGRTSGSCGDDEPSGQRVSGIAVAGKQVAWVRTIAGNTEVDDTLFTATIGHLGDHKLAAARRLGEPPVKGAWIGTPVAGGNLVAVSLWTTNAAGTITSGSLRTISGTKLTTAATGTTAVVAESADLGWIAVLRSDGTVRLSKANGSAYLTVSPTSASEIALRKDYLAVLTKAHTIEIYNANSGTFIRRWPVPAGAAHLDLYDGIAIYAVWRKLHALQLTTGRDVVIASLKRAVVADEIEAPGVVYAYDSVRGLEDFGNLAFVPMRTVAAAVA